MTTTFVRTDTLQPTPAVLKEIADSLLCGLHVFVRRSNGELISIPDPEQMMDAGLEAEEFEDFEQHPEDFLHFEDMSSGDSFRIMADFAEGLPATRLRDQLIDALSNRKPFANFKNLIDSTDREREEWFAFRLASYAEWVQLRWMEQVDEENASDV